MEEYKTFKWMFSENYTLSLRPHRFQIPPLVGRVIGS